MLPCGWSTRLRHRRSLPTQFRFVDGIVQVRISSQFTFIVTVSFCGFLSLTSMMRGCSFKCITATTSTLWTLCRGMFIVLWFLPAVTRTLYDCSWISMGFWPGWSFSGWHYRCASSTGSTQPWHWQRSGKRATRPAWSSVEPTDNSFVCHGSHVTCKRTELRLRFHLDLVL